MKKITVGQFHKIIRAHNFKSYLYISDEQPRQTTNAFDKSLTVNAEFNNIGIHTSPLGSFVCFRYDNKYSIDFRFVKYIKVNDSNNNRYDFLFYCEMFDKELKPFCVAHKVTAILSP